MKKRYVISIITVLLITLSFFAYNEYSQKEEIKTNKGIAIYLQDENNESNYILSNLNTLPNSGYIYNEERTTCNISGVKPIYDEENNKFSLNVTSGIKCNLYFDLYDCSIRPNTVVVDTGTVGETSYTPVCDGKYKLEVWGAQGGNGKTSSLGGYGGYSVGILNISDKNTTLYINVGEKGSNDNNTSLGPGGYNGGGSGGYYLGDSYNYLGGGGGATHVATVTKSNETGKTGELKYLEEYKGILVNNSYYVSDKILIVAGGGGGAHGRINDDMFKASGGNAGGFIGSVGISTWTNGTRKATAGSQTSGGLGGTSPSSSNGEDGSFGKGGDATYGYQSTNYQNNWSWTAGGGGGFYGGGSAAHSGSGGGSGYIASSRLISSNGIEKSMYCLDCETSANTETKTYQSNTYCTNGYSNEPTEKCAKAGNGYARITYLGK